MAGSGHRPLDGHALGADGRYHRLGARVLLVDDSGVVPRILMMRGHDPDQPERGFWFTPGGGLEAGETTRAAAVRELEDETGLVLEEHELAGPVWIRTAIFDFASLPYSQLEEIFVANLADAARRDQREAVWTEQETDTIDDVAWLTLEQLAASDIEVFPIRLRESWDDFLPWDGETLNMGEVDE